jgi:hypothetical protein
MEFDETILELVDRRRAGVPGRRMEDGLSMAPFALFGVVTFMAGLFVGFMLWHAR